MLKKLLSSLLMLCLMLSMFVSGTRNVSAMETEKYVPTQGSVLVNIKQYKAGDSIVVYENKEEDYQVVVDIIDYKPVATTFETGNSGWSGGTIPSGTTTLFPHVERSSLGHQKMGFYETVESKKGGYKITEVYNPAIETGIGITISERKLKINQKETGSGGVTAKASMNWIAKENALHSSYNCYLISEINSKRQHKISWKF